MAAVNNAFCNGGRNLRTTPTEALFRFEQMGIARYEMWRSVMGNTTDQLLLAMSGTDKLKQSPEALAYELISLWRLFFQIKGTNPNLETISPDWINVPNVSLTPGRHHSMFFGDRLMKYHPGHVTDPPLQFSAITIFNLFDEVNKDSFAVPEPLREHAAPFLRLITQCLARSDIGRALKHIEISWSLQMLPKDFREAVLDQIRSAPDQATRNMTIHRVKLPDQNTAVEEAEQEGPRDILQELAHEPPESPRTKSVENPEDLESLYRRLVAHAVDVQSHLGILLKIWNEAQRVFVDKESGQLKIPALVYNSFLSGFMALSQSEKTIEVWNHMITGGIKPDARAFNSLLDGCSRARDLNGLKAAWDRMLKSGVEPDEYVWNTYIHGLISLRQINMAFEAMDQMGSKWLASVNPVKIPTRLKNGRKLAPAAKKKFAKPVGNPARPTLEVVNGAIAAIVDISDMRFDKKLVFVHKVLQWASNFSIKPGIITYNNLVKLYIRENDHVTTFKLLRQMEAEGIEGDAATHTMLISAAFNNNKFDHLNHSEQSDRIISLLNGLEKGGLKLNVYVYSNAIDRLLKLHNNISAVGVVMRHMAARNIPPSPQIYTSLVTYHAEQTPPDIATVDAIVAQLFSPPYPPTDNYLFDRIVELYARTGEVGKMMATLTRMSKHGKLPSWPALTAAVKALAEASDWERARHIVKDVQTTSGVAQGGIMGGWQARGVFFAVVRSYGQYLEVELAGDALQHAPALARTGNNVETQSDGRNVADEGLDYMTPEAQDLYDGPGMESGEAEFVNAEHAGYLSEEMDGPAQQQQQQQR
ncbi:hypothetical protein P280DRAFT_468482 [Massarina eburnea CBS 473.64]|uniref:Pentacotripeptide-repeat region of PRORP domain-containing protein n=1 Tax=Massarina eburnea CBS 473.64 TaxID=1395130 RepID=A0A6A6S5J9_9PLEO|nr:hypothetical protein P280DRAFT_468482 [Massarina eburnea CBS 473.64]